MIDKGGRPRKELDLQELEKLAQLKCTMEEASAHLAVSKKTLIERLKEDKYREAWDKGNSKANLSLRRAQFETALKGNVSMQIWLGKQWLGQTENPVSEQDNRGLVKEFIEHIKTNPPKGG